MPYIKSDDARRQALRNGEPALTAGELNYQIFYYVKHYYMKNLVVESEIIIKNYIDQFLEQGKNYQRYNDVTGALVRCYRECKRRLNIIVHELIDIMDDYDDEIAKYEDKKIISNGDVE